MKAMLFYSPGRQEKDNKFLSGLYAPVDEEVSAECTVTGVLPEAVSGEYARNGPNPRFTPKGGYHWFDGDGMVSEIVVEARQYEGPCQEQKYARKITCSLL